MYAPARADQIETLTRLGLPHPGRSRRYYVADYLDADEWEVEYRQDGEVAEESGIGIDALAELLASLAPADVEITVGPTPAAALAA
ncbi:Uncharacterised protein [Mycobacteroides abscessus subsp. abscessus]|nr:Uncharacterised protein [Mycobacteroides abscessus subsp. abscessus]